jgi:hypothetical protein
LHELLAKERPEQAERLLREHRDLYSEQTVAGVEMSVRSARAWLRRGQLDRARDAIERVSPEGADQAARQASVLGWMEILAGRPEAARGHLQIAAAIPSGEPGTRIEALELLGLVEAADSAGLVALGAGVVAATASGDPGPLQSSVTTWSVERTPGGAGLAAVAAEELQAAGHDEAAHAVRAAIVEGWPGSPEAARALLDLARADRAAEPVRAVAWLERLIVEYPESAMAPIARRILAELRREVPGA